MPEVKKRKFNPKAVIEDMKESKRSTFVFSLNLALVSLAIFAAALFMSSLLYLLIPFILIPWAYASMIMIADKQANEVSAPSLFFASFGMYYRSAVFGSYRLIRNYFISLLVGVLSGVVTGFIYYYVVSATNTELSTLMNQVYFYISNGNTDGLTKLLSVDSPLTKMLSVCSMTEFVVFFLIFIHCFGVYGLNALARTAAPSDGLSQRQLNGLYTQSIRAHWKQFFKVYYGMLYPLFIIEIAGGVGGYFLSGLIPDITMSQQVIFGVGLAVVLLSLCYGYYAHALHLMQEPYSMMMIKFLYNKSKEVFSDPECKDALSEDDQAEVDRQLKEFEKMIEDENKDCNSSESNDDSVDKKKEDDNHEQ